MMRSRKTRINYAKDWEYTTNDTMTLVIKYIGSKTNVVVPNKIEGKPVVLQNNPNYQMGVFTNNKNITSVRFTDGVKFANNNMHYAFYNCHNLINAPVIPNSVTDMGSTFENCTNLVNAPVIPNSVTSMSRTFLNCYNLVNAPVIPNGVTYMVYTFGDCRNLKGNIYIKSNRINNTSMQSCFYNTTLPKNVYIPSTGLDATNNTWNAAFNSTYGINGKNGVTVYDIGDTIAGQWEYTTNATSALITKYIGTKTDVVVPYEIDGKNVVLQNSPNSSNGVFTNNKNITSVRFLIDGTKIANSNASNMFTNCSNLKGVSIMPNGVTNMSNAFLNCQKLSEAPYIPNSVTNVCNAFTYCHNLQGIVAIPPSVTNMAYAFRGSCPSIKLFIEPIALNAATMNCAIQVDTDSTTLHRPNIYVYNSMANAPCNTYNYRNYLVKDKYGADIDIIGSKYFYENQIANMDTYSSNAFYYKPQDVVGGGITIRGVNDSYMRTIYVPCMITNESVSIMSNGGSYPPPFANTNVQSVIFGTSVQWRSNDATNAFRNCKSLIDVKGIPSNIRNMVNAFYSCTSLINSPILPNNITYMYQSFCGCTNLVNAPVIPDSGYISNMSDMFTGCVNLINGPIIFSQTSNLSNTFRDCISLINAPILSTIKMSTTMPNTFRNCTNLVNVFAFPSSIATMNFTFCDCYNLINIPTIPRGTLAMCYTFQNCNNLKGTIVINSNRINNTSMQNCFYGTTLSKNVYIPSSGYSSKANTWNTAFNTTYGINGKNGVKVYDINTYTGSY